MRLKPPPLTKVMRLKSRPLTKVLPLVAKVALTPVLGKRLSTRSSRLSEADCFEELQPHIGHGRTEGVETKRGKKKHVGRVVFY